MCFGYRSLLTLLLLRWLSDLDVYPDNEYVSIIESKRTNFLGGGFFLGQIEHISVRVIGFFRITDDGLLPLVGGIATLNNFFKRFTWTCLYYPYTNTVFATSLFYYIVWNSSTHKTHKIYIKKEYKKKFCNNGKKK